MRSPGPFPFTFNLAATLTPPSPSRAWLTAPHPTLPIIATAHADKTVRIYSLTSHTLLSTVSGGHKRSIRTCAWKPNLKDGENVLATGSFDASVGIWRNWEIDSSLAAAKRAAEPSDSGAGIGEGIDGNQKDEEDDEEWRFAIVLDGHESEVKSVAWSTGGNLLATSSRDKSVWIWEEVGEDDYETVAVLQEHEGDVKCVAWHPEEELLASASYDDDIRLWREDVDDWSCVGLLRGHEGTVWCVTWERMESKVFGAPVLEENGHIEDEDWKEWIKRRKASGPRLLSSSDDGTIRVWRHVPTEKIQQSKYSIIRSGSNEEEWIEEARLPTPHVCGIYAVSWASSGRVVSTGADGLIVAYEERWSPTSKSTTWAFVGQESASHGVFEVNHVTWSRRKRRRREVDSGEAQDVECVISTGDDGSVKIWDFQTAP